MTEEIWKLVEYDCQDGKCLMIWNIDKDSKLGALSLDHRSIGEAIIEELNELENYNRDIKEYVETVEEANNQLRNIRDRLEEENTYYKKREETLLNEIEDFQELLAKNDGVCHKRVIDLIDDRISNFSNVRAELLLNSDDDYRLEKLSFAIQNLRELKKELSE